MRAPVTKLTKSGLADRGAALPAWPLLFLICAASATTVVILGTSLTFFNDDWYFLLLRPGFSAESLFAPHNDHLSALAVLVYKGLVALFGLDAQLPFRLVLAATVVALGIMVYLLVSERAGRMLGLVAATIVVFLGPAWEDLLWSFQIGLIGSMATGLAVIYALERDTPRGDAIACLLLVCSISLSDLGIPFVVAATIAVVLRRRPLQLWISAVPTVLFGIWWLAYGSDAGSDVTAANIRALPEYVLDCLTSGLASIAGLSDAAAVGRYLLLVIVAAGLAAWLIRGGRPPARILVFIGAALTFWILAGANYIPGREAVASRYQLVHATLLILIAAELLRPVRLSPGQAAAVLALALLALGSNLTVLRDGYRFMRHHSAFVKVDIGALELTRSHSHPTFTLTEPVAHDPFLQGVIAGRYFSETDAHGSPASYSPEEIAAAPPDQRRAADSVIAASYRLSLDERGRRTSQVHCRRPPIRPDGRTSEVEMRSMAVSITNLGEDPLQIGVRRFAPSLTNVQLDTLEGRASARIAFPQDSVGLPWHLTARGLSALEVCPL